MKILADECLPVRIKEVFGEFNVFTVRELGWTGIKNGSLIRKAVENESSEIIIVNKDGLKN
ncbi:MAG: hypothetical protein R6W90_06810 [Ignavibacteriaceae bacterium]